MAGSDALIGRTISHYHILEKLGRVPHSLLVHYGKDKI
jgi:hypothetical protein